MDAEMMIQTVCANWSPKYKEAIRRIIMEDQSTTTIAKELGVSRQAVNAHVSKFRKTAKELWSDI